MNIALYSNNNRINKIYEPLELVNANYTINPKYPFGFDIIVCDTPNKQLAKLVSLRKIHKTPIAYRMRGNAFQSADEWIDSSIKRFFLKKYILHNVDICIPITNFHANLFTETTGKPSEIVKLPINSNIWPTKRHSLNELRILTLTNATYKHKIKPLAKIAPVVNEFLDINGGKWLIGSWNNKYDDILHSIDEKFDKITYGGKLDAKKELRYANCMLHYSNYDGFPNAILEGMASRLPIITNDYPSFCEIGKPLEITYNNYDLENALIKYSSPDIRNVYGDKCLQYVKKYNSHKTIGKDFLSVFNEVIK